MPYKKLQNYVNYGLILLIIINLVANIYQNNQIKQLESEIKQLKEENVQALHNSRPT